MNTSQEMMALAPAAHPWRRMMGLVYECIILFGVLWFADYAFSTLTRFDGTPGPLRYAFQFFQFLVLGSYFVGFWRNGLRTLPMKTLSLLLTDNQGAPVTTGRAALRFVASLGMLLVALALTKWVHPLAFSLALLPYLWALLDRDRQTLYDRIAGTRLIYSDVTENIGARSP